MCPIAWQNQYELTQDSVPESMRALLPILETIEKCTEFTKDKPKSGSSAEKPPKDTRKMDHSGPGRIPKKPKSDKYCSLCKTHGGAHTTHNTTECRRYHKDGNPKKGTPPKSTNKPYKKTESSFAQLSERFDQLEKVMKKSLKSSKKKRSTRDISSDSDSE
jgi:hypothetical protein